MRSTVPPIDLSRSITSCIQAGSAAPPVRGLSSWKKPPRKSTGIQLRRSLPFTTLIERIPVSSVHPAWAPIPSAEIDTG